MSVFSKRFSKLLKFSIIIVVLFLLFSYTHISESDLIPISIYDGIGLSDSDNDSKNSLNEYSNYLKGFLKQDNEGSVNYGANSHSGKGNSDKSKGSLAQGSKPPATSFSENAKTVEKNVNSSDRTKLLKEFYSQVFDSIRKYSPVGKCARKYKESCILTDNIPDRPENSEHWFKLTKKALENCLEFTPDEFKMLKSTHDNFVNSISKLTLPKQGYSKQGIVMVGGGKFSMLAFLIIKTLRNLGTTLPVEVFIPPVDEAEKDDFCKDVLPNFNAKCIFISDVLPEEQIKTFDFKGYQFKSLALISSSFEDLLLLDADNFPVKNLDNIFDQEPYKSKGLILWPDFWRRTTTPVYYQIADVPVDYTKRVRNSIDDLTPPEIYTENLDTVPLHDLQGTIPDPSTESGQLLINKKQHVPTLLLSLYYNINGPNWYYPMFTQKAAGEGDKETFIAAAVYYDLPFYQVKTKTGVDGYHQADNKGFRGVAMLQHDFVQDYKRFLKAKDKIQSIYKTVESRIFDKNYSLEDYYKNYILKTNSFDKNDEGEVDIMFVHSNLPKFDPISLWKQNELIVNGEHIRGYRAIEKLNNYDIELENFKTFNQYLCVEKTKFVHVEKHLENEQDRKSMCDYIKSRLEYLEKTHDSIFKKD
ncbi:hypothetical protein TPHA_0A04380 [Tetrapisispora phaffii CBS 4417]|uniref:Alpha-1,2-mannosyltransferase MNN2 n=1 Tax=Tetrapisispora phaffii (strain ATCC 24235 / CBS 4417 / NBRC 1672 / NRRL Y-8282 / UCD 70-5) TaxID=1071381 RepID=G8BNN3_TETPH|nr:hypothetical protein TPHA_0A04380 [Tetrapisispora phaffii CBS 4417]CCE61511.1 hypothetical protein TPHA_0A04380 [Tetrapisispora phaffii CBS 4417]